MRRLHIIENQKSSSDFGSGDLSAESIRAELSKILRSTVFVNSDRLSRFLHFTVEAVLAGNADSLKEYVIGIEAYNRKPPYHPAQDSIVRTEARRLRKKLKEYYEAEGKDDVVFIYFRPGSYVPVFRSGVLASDPVGDSSALPPCDLNSQVAVAVLPFVHTSASPLAKLCARELTDALIHELTRRDGVRVIDRRSCSRAASQHLSTSELAKRLGVQVIVEGTVRIEFNSIKVTAQLVDPEGFQVWSQVFEARLDVHLVSLTLERIASAFVSRMSYSRANTETSETFPERREFQIKHDLFAAEELLDKGTPAALEVALNKCKEVLRLLPRCARAHADLAACCCAMSLSGVPESALWVARGRESVARANHLEPGSIATQSHLACLLWLEGERDEAEACFRFALKLGSCAQTERQFALFLCAQQRFDEAWYYLRRAELKDAFSHHQKTAYSRFVYLSRDYAEIGRCLAESSKFGPPPLESRLLTALSQARSGRIDQAVSDARTLRREVAGSPVWMSCIAEALALSGRKSEAGKLAHDAGLLSPHSFLSEFRRARLLLALDEREAALSALSTALERREAELVWLDADPGFDTVRDSGAFRLLTIWNAKAQRASTAGD